MNVVTGATGLVGSHVMLALLKQGKPVTGLRRSTSDVSAVEAVFACYDPSYKELFKKITWRDADITDVFSLEDAFAGADTVYHCAGYVSFDDKERDTLFTINATGTSNVVNTAIEKKVKALCHVSSVATLQNADITSELDETVFWKPDGDESAYAISKYMAEREAWRASEEGLATVIVNPGVIIGPCSDRQGSGQLIALCRKGTRFYTGGVTGFVSAMDVADMMVRLTEEKKYGERFILVENNYSFKEIFDLLHRGFNRPVPSVKAGKWMLNLARFLSKIIPGMPRITRAAVNSSLSKKRFSSKKVRSILNAGFTPMKDCIAFTCKTGFSGGSS